MPELVEQRGHFVEGEQRGLACAGLRDVQVIGDHRFRAEQLGLVDVLSLPSAALFVVPREVIGEKQSQRRAVSIEYFEGPHVSLVDGQIVTLFESDAVKSSRREKDTI